VSTIANRTILPDIDMNQAGFIVTGTGPDGSSFQKETTETMVEVKKLAFGEWTVVVESMKFFRYCQRTSQQRCSCG